MRFTPLFFALTGACLQSFALEPDKAAERFLTDIGACASLALIASSSPEIKNDPVKVAAFQTTAQPLVQLLSESLGAEEAQRRLLKASTEMSHEIGKDWSNFTSVRSKYARPCTDVFRDPKARLQYWLKQSAE